MENCNLQLDAGLGADKDFIEKANGFVKANTFVNNKNHLDFANYSLEEELERVKDVGVSGYKVMIRTYQPKLEEKKTGSGIYLSSGALAREAEDNKFRSPVGLVLKMGAGAYKDKEKFKDTGPYCKVGDWVRFPRYSGASISRDGIDYIDIDDDLIIGIEPDPTRCSILKSNSNY